MLSSISILEYQYHRKEESLIKKEKNLKRLRNLSIMLLLAICLAYTFSSNVYAVNKGDIYTFSNGVYIRVESTGPYKPTYSMYIPKSVGKPNIIHDYEVYGTGNRGDWMSDSWIARYFAVIPFGKADIYDAYMVLYDNGAIVDAGDYWQVRAMGMIYTTPGSGFTSFDFNETAWDYYGNSIPIPARTPLYASNKYVSQPRVNGKFPSTATCYGKEKCLNVGWTNLYAYDSEGGKELRLHACKLNYANDTALLVPFIETFPEEAIHQHSYTVTANATCTTAGTRTCSCGDTQTIPATGHSWGGWQKTKDPTVYEPGTEVRTCRNNGSHTESRSIAKKNFTIYSGSARVQKIYLGTSLIMNAASGNSGLVK